MERVAAAIALYSKVSSGLEIYLVHRAEDLRFFGGYFAMPGGVRSEWDGPDDPELGDGPALRACAIRELFEETGVLLDSGMRALPEERRCELRRTLLDRDDAVSSQAWRDLQRVSSGDADLREICRIKTPAFAPVRYDTVFFLAELPAGEVPEVWPGELTGGQFQTPKLFLDDWTKGDRLIVPPVLVLLQHLVDGDLDRFLVDAAAMADGFRRGKLHRVWFSPGILMASLTTPTLPPATTTNCFLVGEDRLFIIDPGAPKPSDQAPLFELLDELVAGGTTLEAVVCTHHHPDHVGAVNAVSQRYKLPVHGHEITLDRLEPGFHRGRTLADGDRIDLGTAPDGSPDWYLEAIFTPGHDRGHLTFLDSRYRALIAGDMISTVATIMIDPPEGHLDTYMASLRRLRDLPMTTLYPSHGPATPNGRRIVEKFIKHREMRQSTLERVLREGPGTVEALLPAVYWDVEESMYPYAARSLCAGLEKLEEEGRATEEAGVWRAIAAD
ncbi:MAG: MBL fold metallo-hydrolase [Planctomycetota bacterium]|nr:MBL fold metallo-hydrolase [Planctomycetota bacterium]